MMVGSGNSELAEKLIKAFQEEQPIKLIIAVPKNNEEVDKVEKGIDGGKIKKDFFHWTTSRRGIWKSALACLTIHDQPTR